MSATGRFSISLELQFPGAAQQKHSARSAAHQNRAATSQLRKTSDLQARNYLQLRSSGSKALGTETTGAEKGSTPRPLTLPEKDVTHGCVDVVIHGVPAVDHQAVHELHGLGALTSELARHDHLAALGAALHDEAEDTVAGSAGREQNELWVSPAD